MSGLFSPVKAKNVVPHDIGDPGRGVGGVGLTLNVLVHLRAGLEKRSITTPTHQPTVVGP